MFCDYLNKLCEGSRDQERKKKVLSQPLGVFDVLATNQIWPELQLWGYGTCEKNVVTMLLWSLPPDYKGHKGTMKLLLPTEKSVPS